MSSSATLPLSKLREGPERTGIRPASFRVKCSRRLQDLGLIPGTCVSCLYQSAFGDPCAYSVRGAAIALRQTDSQKILIKLC